MKIHDSITHSTSQSSTLYNHSVKCFQQTWKSSRLCHCTSLPTSL